MRPGFIHPDAAARRLWLKFERYLDRLNRYNQALALRGNIWTEQIRYCKSMTTEGTCDRPWGRSDLYNYTSKNVRSLFEAGRRLNAAAALARSGTAAIQLNEDKTDFSIVVPEGTITPEWIESARFDISMLPGSPMSPGGDLGVVFVPLVVYGLVVVVGMVTGALTAVSVCNVLQKKYDVQITELNRAAEKDFCSDPNSQTCKTWLGIRKEERLNEKQSWVDKILGGGAGKAIGAGVGLAVAIGLGLYAYSTYKSRKK